jgi:hypothetical protein
MLLGGYLAKIRDRMCKAGLVHLLGVIGLVIMYYGFLVLMREWSALNVFQGLVHVMTIPIVYLSLVLAESSFVRGCLMRIKGVSSLIAFVGSLSLEVYLLQSWIYSSKFVTELVFPFNIVAFWIVVLFASWILARSADIMASVLWRTVTSTMLSLKRGTVQEASD